jgi:D-inositol-3-phosphate glycosyltransferase
MPEPARVGMYLPTSEPLLSEHGVFGRDLAVDGFVDALLRYGSPGEYRFFRSHNPLAVEARRDLRLERAQSLRPDLTVSVNDFAQLKRSFAQFPFRLWHDLDGDLHLGATLRARYSRVLYPVTATPYIWSYPGMIHEWILRLMLQNIYSCDSFICNSQAARQAAENLFAQVSERLARAHGVRLSFRGRLDVIPLGVDTELFRPREKAEARRELGLPEHAFLILWPGRLSFLDKADLLPLVQVFRRLVSDNPSRKLMLVIAGSGLPYYAKAVQDYAARLGLAEDVLVVRPLPPERRHTYYNAADVYVSPADNIQETFGLTPLEALASGVPQVVTDWNGYREAVQDGETGFLIPTYFVKADEEACLGSGLYDGSKLLDHLLMAQSTAFDVEAYQRALQVLIDNDPLRERMAVAARRRAVEQFDWSRVIRSHETLWRELSDIAKELPYIAEPHSDYATPAFVDIFGHYATEVLPGTTRLEITDSGRRILLGDEVLPMYMERFGTLSRQLIVATLTGIETRGPADLDTLALEIGEGTESPPTLVVRHLSWLLKYGFVRLSGQRSGDR